MRPLPGHAVIGKPAFACVAAAAAAAWIGTAIAKEAMTADAARKQFVLAEEPAGATTIADAKSRLEKQPDTPVPVVVAGRIFAREHDPFLEGKASFIMIDIVDDGHAQKPGHDADNCPFCKKRQSKLPLAAVQFEADGAVIPLDSRQLFGLSKGQEVVVRGSATYTTVPMPVVKVKADAIHVRPK